MTTQTLNAKTIAKMFLAGANNLNAKKEWINELNVFPVPDGDTGTNMTLTIMSASKEVLNLDENLDMQSLCKAISSGSLRGARGNSGVILSQLLRGFTKVIKENEEIDAIILAQAFNKAVETAYKAVMKPKEGTILTVARGAAEKASELCEESEDLESFLGGVIEHAEYVLSQTPEMLPVLKQAGVVDSGGQGLLEVLKGAYDCLLGKEIEFTLGETVKSGQVDKDAIEEAEIKFGYCTEFIILLDKVFNSKNEIDFKSFLESIGDSIVCVADDDIVKVHVHTNDPGLAIQRGLKFGQLTSMKIDNMREEHNERIAMNETKAASQATEEAKEPPKPYGFISVSVGEGLDEIFRGLGVDYIIEGGQTMNPSTEDMLNAIEKVNAETIYILPNNKNIILAANQAQALTEDKKVIVVPTKTVPQGITALITFAPENSADENEAVMTEEINRVKTGQVTYAVRDTVIDDKEIKQGNIMGIGDHTILSVGSVVEDTAKDMIAQMVEDDSELISIYFGSEVDEEIATEFASEIESLYPNFDVEVNFGGQPIYYYIISVE
ncbi:MAG: DAK2 domain-containing protein [Lachnospiraceae bacterium]|nr:DAK2 domain-containing protein [Lachnospiraceae bacterium]